MKENKKLAIVLIIVIVLLIIVSAGIGGGKSKDNLSSKLSSTDADSILSNAQNESSAVKDNEKKDFTQIDVDKYLEYYAGSENKIVLLARPTCHYCQIAEPIIQNIAYKYDIDINYLNTDNFTDDAQKKFINSNETFKEGYGTPYLMIVANNKIVDSVDGVTDAAHYKEFFKKFGYIK